MVDNEMMSHESAMAVRRRCWENKCLQMVTSLLLMIMCAAVLAWTKNKLEIPTYWNRNQDALYFGDLFKSQRPTTTIAPLYPVTKVLLIAYDRGGANFFRETFNLNSEVFHWVEHFSGVHQTDNDNYMPGGKSDNTASDTESEVGLLHGIYNCNHKAIKAVTYNQTNTQTGSSWVRHYVDCIHGNDRSEPDTDASVTNVDLLPNVRTIPKLKRCVRNVTEACTSAEIRAVSSIRIRMATVSQVLEADPGIKIVYLVRDPRSILASRSQAYKENDNRQDQIKDAAARLCRVMRQDRKEFVRLTSSRRNFLQVRYEQLAQSPLQTTVRLYKFLGRDVPEDTLDAMHRITHSARTVDAGALPNVSEDRGKSKKWWEVFDKSTVKEIETLCEDVIRGFDYSLA